MATAHVIIDPDSLGVALESHEAETEWVLDLRSGEVLPVIDPAISGDDTVQQELEREPQRYLYIEPIPSTQSFRIMEAFAAGLPPSEARSALIMALGQHHPFREFKAALLALPQLRAQWFAYHDAHMRTIAEQWLEDNGVNGKLRIGPSGAGGV
ncbi:MAG: UPF0158 family protein [Acidobacteriota bacterium]